MRWYPDTTGRLEQRPFYECAELDDVCEQTITDFLTSRRGHLHLPISTNDLVLLLERDTEDLDLYTDLSKEGPHIHGVTHFTPGEKPTVEIARELSEESHREHRLRTTLTHEYGHVKFHALLYELPRTLNMFVNRGRDKPRPCHRDTMLRAGPGDWMEWQAGYVSGALLMPISALRTTVQEWMGRSRCALPPCEGSIRADNLIREVAATFFVSKDAARVRLSQRGYLRKEQSGSPLLA